MMELWGSVFTIGNWIASQSKIAIHFPWLMAYGMNWVEPSCSLRLTWGNGTIKSKFEKRISSKQPLWLLLATISLRWCHLVSPTHEWCIQIQIEGLCTSFLWWHTSVHLIRGTAFGAFQRGVDHSIKHNPYAKRSQCSFAQTQVEYLGHVIN